MTINHSPHFTENEALFTDYSADKAETLFPSLQKGICQHLHYHSCKPILITVTKQTAIFQLY